MGGLNGTKGVVESVKGCVRWCTKGCIDRDNRACQVVSEKGCVKNVRKSAEKVH